MDRPFALVVVALLVASAAGVPTVGVVADRSAGDAWRSVDGAVRPGVPGAPTNGSDPDSPTDGRRLPNETNDTPNRLGVGPGPVVSGFVAPSAELSTAVSLGDGGMRGGFLAYRVLRKYEMAETDGANRSVIEDALDRIRNRTEDLELAEGRAIRQYHRGEIGDRELLRRLARIDATAGVYRTWLDSLKDVYAFDFQLDKRYTALEGILESVESPVRDRLNRSFRGGGDGPVVHVVASETGLVVETIWQGRYYREAVRTDHVTDEGPPAGLDAVIERVRSFYSRIEEESGISNTEIGTQLWKFGFSHRLGTTTVYLGHRSGQIYREYHSFRLESIPTGTVANVSEGGVRLVVNRTDRGNPYLVRVLDARTGNPVGATVSFGDRTVGRTGTDGTLWALAPRGEFEVSVDTGLRTLNVSVGG